MDHHQPRLRPIGQRKLDSAALAGVEGVTGLQHHMSASLTSFPEADALTRLLGGQARLAEQGVLIKHVVLAVVPNGIGGIE